MRSFKKYLAFALALLMALTVLPTGLPKAEAARGELLLATVSDIHYYPESLAKYKSDAFYDYLRGSNCVYDNLHGVLNASFDSIAQQVKKNGLKYLVVCGDLTTNGEYKGHVELAKLFRRLEDQTGVHVYVINGNHDINNPDAADFSYPDGQRHEAKRTTAKDFYNIYYEFGFDEAQSMFSDPYTGKAGALSYALSKDGFRFIMIDAGKYTKDNTAKKQNLQETGGNITPAVYEWVKKQVAAAKKKGETPLVFTHWNASEMNYMHGEVLQGFVIDNAYKLQEELADMGVHYYFSGHQHVSDIDVTYSDSGEPLYSVISPTLTQFPFAYRTTKFTKGANGSVTAEFRQIECDHTSAVKSAKGETYPKPYRETGFRLQCGNGTPEDYLLWLAKGMLSKFIDKIRKAGSVVAFLKDEFGLDVEAKLDELIKGGVSVGSLDIFTVKNIMSFIADLDGQIMSTYINNPDRLWYALGKTLKNFVQVQVSDVPCTRFLDTYGFGDPKAPGTVGDLFFSVLAYMYRGNEDISGDAFMQDVIEKSGEPAFVDLIFGAAEKYIVEDLLVNEILANLYVHIDSVFNGKAPGTAGYLQFMYLLLSTLLHENVFTAASPADFVNKAFNRVSMVAGNRSSYKVLLEAVLGTGLVKYGKNVKEVVNTLLDTYFDQPNKEATAEQLRCILEGDVTDADKDWNVSYNYNGPVKVKPTAEDMQVPTDVVLRFENNNAVLHWLTKYSVTGTDIRISEKNGAAVPASQIKAETAAATYSAPGFSFGSFGILPWTREINAHTVTVSSLKPGKTYVYKIGDASKDFWSKSAAFTVPEEAADSFSFLYFGDFAASTAAGAQALGSAMSAAAEEADARFVLLNGPGALNGENDSQYSAVLNAAAEPLAGVPAYYVPAAGESPNVAQKHFNTPAAGAGYSFDQGSVHIAVLDPAGFTEDGLLSEAQLEWLKADLAASNAAWNVLALSEAVLTASERNEKLSSQLLNVAKEGNVDLILEGGAKAYVRTHMISGGRYLSRGATAARKIGGKEYDALVSKGVVALCPGAAGGSFAEVKANKARFGAAFRQNMPQYSVITVSGGDLAVVTYAFSQEGERSEVRRFAIAKEGKKLMLGDIDMNGQITAEDARLALRRAVDLEKFTPEQFLAADVDLTGSVTAEDARIILRAAVDLQKIEPEYKVFYQKDLDRVNP